jgi:hypothetical protein
MTKQFRRTIQLVFIYNVSWFCTSSGSRDMAMSHKIDRVFLFFLFFSCEYATSSYSRISLNMKNIILDII